MWHFRICQKKPFNHQLKFLQCCTRQEFFFVFNSFFNFCLDFSLCLDQPCHKQIWYHKDEFSSPPIENWRASDWVKAILRWTGTEVKVFKPPLRHVFFSSIRSYLNLHIFALSPNHLPYSASKNFRRSSTTVSSCTNRCGGIEFQDYKKLHRNIGEHKMSTSPKDCNDRSLVVSMKLKSCTRRWWEVSMIN